jgi:hypothetical protein
VAQAPVIHSHRVIRQMDHLIMALRTDPSIDRPGFFLSLYWIGYAAETEPGHVAYLWTTGADGAAAIEAVLTDNPATVAALGPRLRPRQWPLADPDRPAVAARFVRTTSSDWGISFRIEADGLVVEAAWEVLSPPVFSSGTTAAGDARITTLLTESHRPSALVNGQPQPGVSFHNPVWKPWFGNERGSCILGLGETIYEVTDE